MNKYFKSAEIKEETEARVELLMDRADENLNAEVAKALKQLGFRFSLIERTANFKIRIVFRGNC